MAQVILNCPQCQRPLRVTDELLGRLVKCPACQHTFTAPTSVEPAPVPLAAGEPSEPGGPLQGEVYEPAEGAGFRPGDRERAKGLLLPPAICLLVIAILGLCGDLVQVAMWLVMSDKLMEQMHQQLAAFGVQGPVPSPQLIAIIHACFAGVSLLIVAAAIQMLRRRMYGLAILGSFLAVLNCDSYCCVPGFFIGIWALVILMRQDVRGLFSMPPRI
jgi:predicted Zn finger-like uncharacterized protein